MSWTATGSMQFICVVPMGRDHAGGRSGGSRRNACVALHDWICFPPDIAGTELGSRGDSVVGGGDDIVGEVDQSSPGWLCQRGQLVGRDLAGSGPGDAFVAGLALLDRDLRLPLGPHADDARGSREPWVIGRG